MGRGGAKGRERASLPPDHWTYHDPDRELWTPSQLAHAQQVPSRAAWDAMYGGSPADPINFLAAKVSPQTREAAREALRLYKSGDPKKLLAIVRKWGEPEWGEGSFLESLYQRAFLHTAKSEIKARGHKLLQKDKAADLLLQARLQSFYQSLRDCAMSRAPEVRALGDDWAGMVMRSSESELGSRLREEVAAQPLSQVSEDLARGLIRLGGQPELQESFEREVSLRIENMVAEAPFWSRKEEQVSILGQGTADPDVYRLQYGPNPLLHIKDPQRGYGTLCGARSGYGVRRGSWQAAAFNKRRCRKCEKALLAASGDEIDHLRERLEAKNTQLPLPLLGEDKRRDHYNRIFNSFRAHGALGSLAGLGSGDNGKGEVISAVLEESVDILSDLEARRCEEIDREISRAPEEEREALVTRKWSGWREMLSLIHRNDLRELEDLNDDGALSEIFSRKVKRSVIVLYARQAAERARGEADSAMSLGKAIKTMVDEAAEKYIQDKKADQERAAESASPEG